MDTSAVAGSGQIRPHIPTANTVMMVHRKAFRRFDISAGLQWGRKSGPGPGNDPAPDHDLSVSAGRLADRVELLTGQLLPPVTLVLLRPTVVDQRNREHTLAAIA